MYKLPKGVKENPVKRWALPDRIFFACGACHILTFAFLERFPSDGFKAIWIRPRDGYWGNHIVAVSGEAAFDYHGYSDWQKLLSHTERKSNRWWPEWRADLVELPAEVLISETLSLRYPGLWLREPEQYLYDALPRARRFLAGFGAPDRRAVAHIPELSPI